MVEDPKKDYKFVQDGQKTLKPQYILFGIGVIMLIALFLLTNLSSDENIQTAVLWISVFAIVASIAWSFRNKIYSVIIAFLILLSIYAIIGWAMGAMNIVEYSYGVITFLIIGVWVFWLSRDNKIGADDLGKVVIFILATYIINQSGWLGEVNKMVVTYFQSGVLT